MTVDAHFDRADDRLRRVYDRLLVTARTNGPVIEEAKKTSIHLLRRTAFAGVTIRRSSIVLTLKSQADIPHPRIIRRDQVSANRWHLEVRLETEAEVDGQLARWLRSAYDLAGPA